jgi:hypothetical protein
MFGSRITKGKRVKIRSISAFKPKTPTLHYSLRAVGFTSPLRAGGQHSHILHVGIIQITTDIPIANSLDSHPPVGYGPTLIPPFLPHSMISLFFYIHFTFFSQFIR